MTTSEHIAALTALVETYVVAMTRGDRPTLERIFFDRASEVGHYEGELLWNSRDAFIAMCEDAADAETDPFWAISSVSVQGNIAQVHVENDWAGMRFDDFLTLLLHEGSWRIVSRSIASAEWPGLPDVNRSAKPRPRPHWPRLSAG